MYRSRWILLLVGVAMLGCGHAALVPLAASLSEGASAVNQSSVVKQRGKPRRVLVMKVAVEDSQKEKARPDVPRVLLSAGHAKLCKVGVDDLMPPIKLLRLDGKQTMLDSLLGKHATVVLFWRPDRWMARAALADLQRGIVKQFDPKQVSVVGIAVNQNSATVRKEIRKLRVTFPQLLDTQGAALAQVGTYALPRIYVLDPAGTIVWFDIEYSEGTRRELQQTLAALTAEETSTSE